MVFFAIFILGILWAGYSYRGVQELLAPKAYVPQAGPNVAQADKTRLDNMVNLVKLSSEIRGSSDQMAQYMMDGLGKYPFGDPLLGAPPEEEEEDDGFKPPLIQPEIVIDYPPEGLTVRAIMIMGKERVAVMDIPGVGSGMMVKAGDTFMQRKGRIVRIAPDKVVIHWGGKNWDIGPNF
jgi:hypothetical protein